MHRNAGGVYLYITRIGESRTTFVANPSGTTIAVHGIGREVVYIAVATRGNYHGMGGIALQSTSHQVASDNAACTTVDYYQLHHLTSLM